MRDLAATLQTSSAASLPKDDFRRLVRFFLMPGLSACSGAEPGYPFRAR
jgi:hypothetical protein